VAGREPDHWQSAAAAGLDALLTDFPLDLRRVLSAVRSGGARESRSGE